MRVVPSKRRQQGIALILVLISVVVLGVLAAGFAWSMRVEVKLARNASSERELEWLGRSGVELARYVLGQQLLIGAEPYDSLNQKWAGGPGSMAISNSPLADIQLENVEIGGGRISVRIVDAERKMNINSALEPMLQQALVLVGLDAAGAQTIGASIQDWRDENDLVQVGGAEKDFYEGNQPAYVPKNGLIDDLSEMLLIKGITPDMLWGSANTNRSLAAFQANAANGPRLGPMDMPQFNVGLADLFAPVSTGKINVNTASATVLQMLPFVDENLVQEILRFRAGLDGAEGTEDDTPLRNVGELVNVIPNRQMVQSLMQFCVVRSNTFEVTVEAEINNYKRRFVALLARTSPRDVQILSFSSR
jgi:general secretion pathway protein K